jgi:hypothetical protein
MPIPKTANANGDSCVAHNLVTPLARMNWIVERCLNFIAAASTATWPENHVLLVECAHRHLPACERSMGRSHRLSSAEARREVTHPPQPSLCHRKPTCNSSFFLRPFRPVCMCSASVGMARLPRHTCEADGDTEETNSHLNFSEQDKSTQVMKVSPLPCHTSAPFTMRTGAEWTEWRFCFHQTYHNWLLPTEQLWVALSPAPEFLNAQMSILNALSHLRK